MKVIGLDFGTTNSTIGSVAKLNITAKNYEVYENFKLRLGVSLDEAVERNTKSPIEVTSDFIRKLLEADKSGQHIENIEYIVVTVSEI